MEINLSNIDFKANRDELKEALAEQLLHNKEFFDTNKRRINFKIYLDMQENMPTRNSTSLNCYLQTDAASISDAQSATPQ